MPVDEGAEQYLPVLEEAAHQWEAILRDTELPDLTFAHEAPFVCHGLSTGTAVAGVDDLMVLASIGRIDGYGGARGGASVCLVREGSLLPVAGTIRLDQEDLFAMSDNDVKDVMLHDLGHTLGIGMIWSARDLLRSPATPPRVRMRTSRERRPSLRSMRPAARATRAPGCRSSTLAAR